MPLLSRKWFLPQNLEVLKMLKKSKAPLQAVPADEAVEVKPNQGRVTVRAHILLNSPWGGQISRRVGILPQGWRDDIESARLLTQRAREENPGVNIAGRFTIDL